MARNLHSPGVAKGLGKIQTLREPRAKFLGTLDRAGAYPRPRRRLLEGKRKADYILFTNC
jgi:hypothetical protein